MSSQSSNGLVVIAGAGPGQPGLITSAAAAWISRAEVIAYDRLVSPDILALARGDAEKLYVGKRPGDPHRSQDEINRLLIARCREGKLVVRLKGGDPMVFGRGAEEAEALAAAGCAFRIIPGVTAAAAAAAFAGIPLTDRRYGSAVAFVTGRQAEDESAPPLDWQALARIDTLVFYMPVEAMERIADNLIRAGKDPDTAAAVVQNASMPTQRTIVSRLDAIAAEAASAGIEPPALLLVGKVVAARRRIAWLEKLPLFGRTIAVTRPRPTDKKLSQLLRLQGANVIEAPTVRIVAPPDDTEPLDAALARLDRFDWVIFTSAKGVLSAIARLDHLGKDARAFGHARIAAVGEPTAAALAEKFLKADLVPPQFTTQALGRALAAKYDLAGKKILLLRSSEATAVLPTILHQAGAIVREVTAYTTELIGRLPDELLEALQRDQLDWIAVTAASIVAELIAHVAQVRKDLSGIKLAAIGPVTANAIRAAGYEPAITACPHTVEALAAAITAFHASADRQ